MGFRTLSVPARLSAIGFLVLVAGSCVPAKWHGLRGIDFSGRTMAMAATIQPPPVYDPHGEAEEGDGEDEEEDDGLGILGTILDVAAVIYEGHAAYTARERLEDARRRLNLPGRMSERLLPTGAEILGAVPARSFADADYHLEVRVLRWGIDSGEGDPDPHFVVEATLRVLDGPTNREVWRGETVARESVGLALFETGSTLSLVDTALALSDLTPEGIVRALEELSDTAADQLADLLRDDLARARGDR